MPDISITPVILCGGAGSRLWPMSRDEKPKQFHALFNKHSLLWNTIERSKPGQNVFSAPVIQGSANLAELFKRELENLPVDPMAILLEPSVRDTAAAIAAATHYAIDNLPDSMILVLPSDARIDNREEFRRTMVSAAKLAEQADAIVTIGINPTRPETQYGYIRKGEVVQNGFTVGEFKEKPDSTTAEAYISSGDYLWNAGMFLFHPARMAKEFSSYQPETWKHAGSSVQNADWKGKFVYLDRDHFDAAPKQSIDYAIMEKTDHICVVPANFDWNDLGSWPQLFDGSDKDENGNALSGEVIAIEASNNFVRARDAVVAVAGVDDLIVVAEDGKVLVTTADQSHLVKEVTNSFKKNFSVGRHAKSKGEIKNWLFTEVLPLWAGAGMDFDHGGAHEALAFDGTVSQHSKKRLRVTARQIYCYAHASMLGWKGDADTVLRHCFETLTKTGWYKEGGFIHLYNPDGTVQSDARDTYDQCFVLLAMAWLHRAKNWPEARIWGDKTLAYMDEYLADHVSGGYFENLDRQLPRRANPHMHFLEAMLAWYEATGEDCYLDRAAGVVGLFEKHFFDVETGSVTERFNDNWSPITDMHADHSVEPGHHYEWAWLLMRFDRLRPTTGLVAKARAIYSTANAFGHHRNTGAVADTMSPDGSNVADSARCWPQTEALKAATIFEKSGVVSAGALRDQMLGVLFTHYFDKPVEGGWYDAIDRNGQVAAPDMPSSTLYHVFCALIEHIETD